MTPLAQLWIPVVASAVLVFVASSVIHMLLKWHNSDYRKLPNEDAVRATIRAANAAPGQYVIPHCGGMKEMQLPESQQKFRDGPVGHLTLIAPGLPKIGPQLGLWFVFNLAIGFIAAYVAAKTLPPGATVGQVCRIVGTVAFLAYAGGSVQGGIWMGRPWASVAKDVVDGLIYGLITGAAFGWLWPR